MAKGQNLSKHQEGIVRRYYQHLDTVTVQKLAESVSELYLCTAPTKSAKLWESVAKALAKTDVDEQDIAKIVKGKDVVALAKLVGELSAGK